MLSSPAPIPGELSLLDRILRSSFVALAVGLGWSIRGDFGHLLGAAYPGAALGLAFAFVTGQASMFGWMPLLGALSGLLISTGGAMSYGILHGYAQSDTFINYTYGFFTLFMQGGAWGTFGCAAIGLMFERERLRPLDWITLIATILVGGYITYFLVVDLIGFDINPPRSNGSIAHVGGALAQIVWLAVKKKPMGLRGALLGFFGFGLGMSGGRFLGNLAHVQPIPINHWNVMEISCGLIGGFVFAFGMLGREFPEIPNTPLYRALNFFGAIYVMTLIPILHRLLRIQPTGEKGHLDGWTEQLKGYGYADPSGLAHTTMTLINALCVVAFLGTLIWIWLHWMNRVRWSAFPIFLLSLVMLLIQNLRVLYFLYPREPGSIDTHSFSWVLFALMALYALFIPRPPTVDASAPPSPPWPRWLATTAAIFALMVFLAGFVNGKTTMTTANTRFPIWSWNDPPRK